MELESNAQFLNCHYSPHASAGFGAPALAPSAPALMPLWDLAARIRLALNNLKRIGSDTPTRFQRVRFLEATAVTSQLMEVHPHVVSTATHLCTLCRFVLLILV